MPAFFKKQFSENDNFLDWIIQLNDFLCSINMYILNGVLYRKITFVNCMMGQISL